MLMNTKIKDVTEINHCDKTAHFMINCSICNQLIAFIQIVILIKN